EPRTWALALVVQLLPGADSAAGLLIWVVLAGLAVFAVNSVSDVVLTFAWIRIGQRTVYDLARALFARLQRRSLLFHTRSAVGDSMARVTTDSWCASILVETLFMTPLFALIALVTMV